jgi:hypothetical protein
MPSRVPNGSFTKLYLRDNEEKTQGLNLRVPGDPACNRDRRAKNG